jgi:chromosome segregation ATPase
MDTLRQSQRDLDSHIHDFEKDAKQQINDTKLLSENFRGSIEEWQSQCGVRMRELDESIEETRRRNREMNAEIDERFTSVRASIDEVRKELTAQSKLFERTDKLKTELNRYVEDMGSNIERISHLKNEIARFENQLAQIKRMEDDINAKMTRFLSENRRIEVMENDFNRLLQTSQSVEQRLSQVSDSDDILQAMQVQLRRLDDVIKETEEKYKRVEKKSKAVQETNDGIDRNFKALQEDEQSIERLNKTIAALKNDMDNIQNSVHSLSAENEKAREAAEKLSTLDETIKHLEKRIAEMNVAREGFARLATELQNLDKDAQTQLKLTRSLLDREEGKNMGLIGKDLDKNALSPDTRDNVIKLKRQGWKVDEISKTLNISKGEVELIIEIGQNK